MKAAVIFYHKNILSIYKKRWIDRCISSIKCQTYQDFDVFELNYHGDNVQLCNNFVDKKYVFYNRQFENHIVAMNFLIDEIFNLDYDVIFNTNMDDYYHLERFSKQMEKIQEGNQLVSSNFLYIHEDQYGNDWIDNRLNMTSHGDINTNLMVNHNVIAHPCVAMHKSFWTIKYNEEQLGYEDLDLWKRGILIDKKFFILEDYLLYYRIHEKQITKSYKGI